jgi:hypothetical protein
MIGPAATHERMAKPYEGDAFRQRNKLLPLKKWDRVEIRVSLLVVGIQERQRDFI